MRCMNAYQAFVVATVILSCHACNDNNNGPIQKFVVPLTVQSFTPALSPSRGGITVDIKGTGFLPGLKVMFNQESAAATWISDSEVKVVTPALGVQGPISVQVVNPNETEVKTENAFTYYSSTVLLEATGRVPEIDATYTMTPIDLMGNGVMVLVAPQRNKEGQSTVIDQFTFDPETQRFQKKPLASVKEDIAVLIAADLNSDGKSDLIAGSEIGTVYILLNNGRGNMLAPLSISLGKLAIRTLTTGDFNQDGKIDIGVVIDNSVFTLLNGAKDGFQISNPSEVGNNAWALAPIDYDHDGALDLLVISNQVANFLKSNQDGTFQPSIQLEQIPKVDDMKVADIDGDQMQDLIFLTSETDPKMLVLLNQNQSFKMLNPISSLYESWGLMLADMDGDHLLDAVVSAANGKLAVLLGKGHGWFGTPLIFDTPVFSYVTAVLDVNGDHKPDLVTQYPADTGNNGVGLMLNSSK